MRIVALSDICNIDELPEEIPFGDVLILAGGLTKNGTLDELRPIAEWLEEFKHPRKLIVPGRNDWCFVKEPKAALDILGPTIDWLEDSCITLAGVQFWGIPWQSMDSEAAFYLDRDELLFKWESIPRSAKIVISHLPPDGVGDGTPMADKEECLELWDLIRHNRPWLFVFGNDDYEAFIWRELSVSFANVTLGETGAYPPTVMELDPGTGMLRAVHVALANQI